MRSWFIFQYSLHGRNKVKHAQGHQQILADDVQGVFGGKRCIYYCLVSNVFGVNCTSLPLLLPNLLPPLTAETNSTSLSPFPSSQSSFSWLAARHFGFHRLSKVVDRGRLEWHTWSLEICHHWLRLVLPLCVLRSAM